MWPKLNSIERLLAIDSKFFSVLPFCEFNVDAWQKRPSDIIESLDRLNLGPTVIVRSCAKGEDIEALEPPGFFKSVLGVVYGDTRQLECAIESVIESYSRRSGPQNEKLNHKIIIQQQMMDPALCGVCHVGREDWEYIYVDFDDTSGRTDAVTAGLSTSRVALAPCLDGMPPPWRSIAIAARQISIHFERPLFIEFAVSRDEQVVIFQVRRDRRNTQSPSEEVRPTSSICRQLKVAARRLVSVGPLSVMADWNPAEMLGSHPKELDISLYRLLLTDGAWAEGRMSMGWRKPRDSNLMVTLGGRPYVKLKTSIESLLPGNLPCDLLERLIADRLDFLSKNQELHDKIEFRVVWSAMALDELDVSAKLKTRGFTHVDVETLFKALRSVTRNAFAEIDGWRAKDFGGLELLDAQRDTLKLQHWPDVAPPLAAEILRTAVGVCRIQGTIPFSRQARLAFMLRYILNFLVDKNAELGNQIAKWYSGLNTITRQLSEDILRLSSGKMSRIEFNEVYGHLRPGAYNLESERYDEILEFPVGISRPVFCATSCQDAVIPSDAVLVDLLSDLAPDYDESRFWNTCGETFRAREEIKFRFTGLLSDVLNALARLGVIIETPNAALRHHTFDEILSVFEQSDTWEDARKLAATMLNQQTSKPRQEAILVLPDLVFDPVDLFIVRPIDARPTFIGSSIVEGPVKVLTSERQGISDQLAGKILVIRSPDPGYDWIFGQSIAGLLTEYGGEFSHMALRCAEFGIPAAIGCGHEILEGASIAEQVALDCKAREIWADGHRL